MTLNTAEVLTTRQVAELFSVGIETVNRWRKSGRLPAVKISTNVVRFTKSDLVAFLKAGQAKH